MSEPFSVEDMHALGSHHAAVEAAGDMEATLATLVDDPVYELLPVGLRMQGREQVRRYYEHLIGWFIPHTRGYELIEEWASESSVAQEYRIQVEVDGAVEEHRVVGILYREGRLLGGERVYASERCLRLMAGDALFDSLEPLD